MKPWWLVVAMLLFVTPAWAKTPAVISTDARDWSLRYSPEMPLHPIPVIGGGWEFDFPTFHIGMDESFTSVNYVTTNKLPRLKVGQTLTMQFEIVASSDAVFEYALDLAKNPCPRPANFRFYIQHGTGNRWWSNPVSWDLVNGQGFLQVIISPELWSNVNGAYGVDAIKSFNKAINGANAIGFTFGGGCFFGHGVWLSSGQAIFRLIDFKVE
jgi:hypothetical protein